MWRARAGTVGQQGLLPTHADPKLWIVETRTGEEREAVIKLLQKAVNLGAAGRPLLIKSAFTQDHLKARPPRSHPGTPNAKPASTHSWAWCRAFRGMMHAGWWLRIRKQRERCSYDPSVS